MKKLRTEQKGITLVTLVITVVILLVLASVVIASFFGDGILGKVLNIKDKYNASAENEKGILSGLLGFFNNFFNFGPAPEDVFMWKSEDQNNEGYGVIVGYTAKADNYPTLRFPDRCTKIEISPLYDVEQDAAREMRRYTGNIREVELPNTVVEIGDMAFSDYEFDSLKKINIPKSVTKIGDLAFEYCHNLNTIIYEGTMEEWKNIPKGYNWNYGVLATYVQCTDGKVMLIEGVDENYEVGDLFIWGSADPTNEDYGVLVGFTSNVQNYPTLTIPERCTKIKIDTSILQSDTVRSYVSTIKEVELPNTITEICEFAFMDNGWNNYSFWNLNKIVYDGTVEEWKIISSGKSIMRPSVALVCKDKTVFIKGDGSIVNYEVTDLFIWGSKDRNDENYGVLVGYTSNVQNYTTLTIPDRCTKISLEEDIMGYASSYYTGAIEEIQLPNTITEIGEDSFNGNKYYWDNLNKFVYSGTVEEWKKISIQDNSISRNILIICSNGAMLLKIDGSMIVYDITDLFIWGSADPSSEEYGVLVGYTSNVKGCTTLTIPDRCTHIELDYNLTNDWRTRYYTRDVKEVQLPSTIIEIGSGAFSDYEFINLTKIIYNGTVEDWKKISFGQDNILLSAIELVCTDKTVVVKLNGKISNYEKTDLFIWGSANPSSEDYGVLVGYTNNIQNYTTLTIPDRCIKINMDRDIVNSTTRSASSNIKEIELPKTITQITEESFANYDFMRLIKITYEGTVAEWKKIAIGRHILAGSVSLACKDRTVLIDCDGDVLEYEATNLFIWKSSDPNSKDYGVLVGYTGNVQNYTTLTIPDRCTKIVIDTGLVIWETTRNYTNNIREIELPSTITEIEQMAFYSYSSGYYIWHSLSKITYAGTVEDWEKISIGDSILTYDTELVCADKTVMVKPNGNIFDYETTDSFVWKSGEKSSSKYGILVGYTENLSGSKTLTIPDRCTRIELDENLIDWWTSYYYTSEIEEIQLPRTITEIGEGAFYNYDFSNLRKIVYAGTVEEWKQIYFIGYILNSSIELVCSDKTVIIKTNGDVIDYETTDMFVWKSGDTSSKDYGVLVGYTTNIQNYTSVIIPDRCTKIDFEPDIVNATTRASSSNVKEIELPNTITEIAEGSFDNYDFYNLTKITYAGTVAEWNRISLHYGWNDGLSIHQVHCTDGTVDI